eukprot:gb/GFBE01036606.1/.p1 GENE.gb/GFBE01036606.1/~~gb/GFBE01036606.1/.p1  ORF type:complete len:684 (+),score=119.22 gb/GFBE01036606.1/:1-2052(+)
MGQSLGSEEQKDDGGQLPGESALSCCSRAEQSTDLRTWKMQRHFASCDEDGRAGDEPIDLPEQLPSDCMKKGVSSAPCAMAEVQQPGVDSLSWDVSDISRSLGSQSMSSRQLLPDELDKSMSQTQSPAPIVHRANSVCYSGDVPLTERLEPQFPMYVISADKLMKLKSFIKHEDAVKKGLVHIASKHRVNFFWSHQWLSYDHPDPNNLQLLCMQGILSKIQMEGTSHLFRDHAHTVSSSDMDQQLGMSEDEFCQASRLGAHWIDFMSVPQDASNREEQRRAILSIAAYASKSHVMMALCPRSAHANTRQPCDLSSWRVRGWCRLELIAMVWTHDRFPIVLCTGPDDCRIASELAPKKMQAADAPCNGHFSCCENKHVKDGVKVECDKFAVTECLRQLHKVRVSAVLTRIGAGLEWRWAKAMLPVVLAGQSSKEGLTESSISLQDFLKDYSLKTVDMDEAGNTILHWACFLGALEVVKSIIADPQTKEMINRPNCREMRKQIHQYSLIAGGGVTPLMLASERGFCNVVQALLEAGAEVNARALYGATALNLAATRGFSECVRELLTAGAEVDTPLNDEAAFFGHCVGFTPLHSAVSAGHVSSAKLLLKAKANPNSCSRYGATALHCAAATRDNVEMVHLLLLSKANPELKCSASYPVEAWRSATPYDIANGRDHCRSAALLQIL